LIIKGEGFLSLDHESKKKGTDKSWFQEINEHSRIKYLKQTLIKTDDLGTMKIKIN